MTICMVLLGAVVLAILIWAGSKLSASRGVDLAGRAKPWLGLLFAKNWPNRVHPEQPFEAALSSQSAWETNEDNYFGKWGLHVDHKSVLFYLVYRSGCGGPPRIVDLPLGVKVEDYFDQHHPDRQSPWPVYLIKVSCNRPAFNPSWIEMWIYSLPVDGWLPGTAAWNKQHGRVEPIWK